MSEEIINQIREANVGMLSVKTGSKWISQAKGRHDPDQLWKSLWHEGEVCCLFADSNLGKSIYAVQIAATIAQHRTVLYCDFELSDKQFQLRYSDNSHNAVAVFPEGFYRAEIDPNLMSEATDAGDFENSIINDIENAALQLGADTIIIDNLTYICNQSDKSDAAGRLMISLTSLKKRYGWSILVIAHTPKRSLNAPITQNDLAGSKKLFNFFDSVFAIGRSAKDSNLRYIKQLKVRSCEFEYDADNVLVADIRKIGCFLRFHEIGTAKESEHLASDDAKDWAGIEDKIIDYYARGYKQSDIADHLRISVGKVNKVIKASRNR